MPAAALVLLALAPGCGRQTGSAPEAPEPPPAPAAAAAPARSLETTPGFSLRRPMRPGETHEYSMALAADHYVHLVIEQEGVDLVAALAGPAGASIVTDGLTGAWGPEEIFWRPAAPGIHRLTLTGDAGDGEYVLRIEELRPATSLDEKRVAAGRWIAEGRARRRAGDLRRALASYERAGALWSELGDPVRRGRVELLLGDVRERLGEIDEALAAHDRGLTLLLDGGGDLAHRAFAAYVLGRISSGAGEPERARDFCRRALEWRQELGDPIGEARAANCLGLAYKQLAEPRQALTYYRRSLARARQIGHRAEEAVTLHNRAKLFLYLGKHEQALDDFTAALALREALGDRRGQASTLNAMGETLKSDGSEASLREAERVYRRALELAAELDDPRPQAALAENNLGWVYARLGRHDEALEALTRARETFGELGLRPSEAVALGNLGWLALMRGEHAEAIRFSRSALEVFERTRDPHSQVGALQTLAVARHATGDLNTARAAIERAIDLVESQRVRSASHDLRSSYFATQQSRYDFHIRLLMDLHRGDPSAGYEAAALTASERARARSLLDDLSESGIDLRHGVAPDLLREERRLERAINARELQRLEALETAGASETFESDLRSLLREYDEVRARIRSSSPRYAALTQPRPLTAPEIQERILDSGTLLLHYDLGDERSFLWAVTPRSISAYELPPRRRIEASARRAYDLLAVGNLRESRAPTRIALAALSETLIAPAAELLAGRRRLLIVSEGALLYLPFGVLPRPAGPEGAGGAPLAFDFEISHVPSASTLAVLRQQARTRPPAPGLVAVVADPVFQEHDPRLGSRDARPAARGGFERLVHSRREAEGILALADPGASFRALGFEATRSMVRSGALGGYRYVHFATHGDLDAEHPELSRLVLSLVDRQGRPRDDGFLYAHEIYALELRADLVVLSACHTALGKEVKGEGLVGLTRGFMYAGASRVVVSLWRVDDRATAELMVRFYELLLERRLSPAAALREAQLSIAGEKPWRSPYYWGPFVLQGEW